MNINISKKGWLIVGTAIIIGIAFSVYFLVYVKNKEKALIANNFRVLRQIKENVNTLEKSYYKNAETIRRYQGESSSVNQNIKPDHCQPNTECSSIDKNISYCGNGIIFKFDKEEGKKDTCYSISYENFFNNELLKRGDIFDYIIVSKFDNGDKGERRKVLYTNSPGGIIDSVFHSENLASYCELKLAANEYISFNQNLFESVYVSGLVNKSKMGRQKRGVSLFVIIISSVILVFIILNMPMIKLKIMSNAERLYASDVVFTGITVLLGSAILLMLLFSAIIYFRSERSISQKYLKHLSKEVEGNFKHEMSQAINQLKYIHEHYPLHRNASIEDTRTENSSIEKCLSFGYNPIDFFEDHDISDINKKGYKVDGFKMYKNVLNGDDSKPFDIDTIFAHYKHFNYIFWNDNKARSLVFLSPFKDPAYVQDLSHRKYLTNVINNTPINYVDKTNIKFKDTVKIGFESIKSVNDGSYEVGIGYSTGNDTLPVLAMSTKLVSMMEPVLPNGYGFCMLDEQGNTVFHSNIQKNMNENFIEETMNEFKPVILSRTEHIETVTYGNKRYIIHFRPLNSLSGHYLATFTTVEYFNTPYSLALTNSILLLLAYLIIVFLVYLVFYFIAFKSNKLDQSGFMFNWLRPVETIAHFYKYRKLIWINILTIGYLAIGIPVTWNYRDFVVNNLLLTTIVLLICSFYYISISLPLQKRINTPLTRSYGVFNYKLAYIVVGLILGGLLLINRIGIINKYSDPQPLVIISIINILLLLFIIYALGFHKEDSSRNSKTETSKSKKGYNVQLAYQLYVFTWVIIVSIIPVMTFFGMAFDKEQEIHTKYNISETLKQHNNWEQNIDQEFRNNFRKEDFNVFKNSIKQNGSYLVLPPFIKIRPINEANMEKYNRLYENNVFDSIYSMIRPYYNNIAFNSNGFVKDHDLGSVWEIGEVGSPSDKLLSQGRMIKLESENKAVESELSSFIGFLKNDWWIILIFFPSILLLYFKLIQFTTKRIYGFEYKQFADTSLNAASQSINNILGVVSNEKNNVNNVFCVSLDTLNTQVFKDPDKRNFYIFDMYDLKNEKSDNLEIEGQDHSLVFNKDGEFESIKSKKQQKVNNEKSYFEWLNQEQKDPVVVLLVKHFEYQFNNPNLNKIKFKILNHLLNHPKVRVVIFSAINALAILDFYRQSIETNERQIRKDPNDKQELLKNLNDLKIEHSKWQFLLGKFTEIVIPIKKTRTIDSSGNDNDQLMQEELNHSTYLTRQTKLLAEYDKALVNSDDKIIVIQQASNPYYFALWNSLSKDEKYLVYDIAKNKFVNTRNSNGVFNLLNKGIFIYDYSLRSFNESFSNFVLSKISNDEILEKEVESRKKGAWSTMFTILLLVIVSLIIFLSIGQQSFLNDINSLLTALGALVGILVRFGGFFSPGIKPD